MRRRSNIFLGALLVAIGSIFLAINYNLFDFNFSFHEVAQFWPVLLILAGIAVLLNERRSFYNPTTALLVAFAIPLAIYSVASDGVRDLKNEFQDDFHFDWDDDDFHWDNDEDNHWENKSEKDYDYGSEKVEKGERVEQKFDVSYSNDIEEVSLKFGGGAAEFHVTDSKDNLFEATTLLNHGSYQLSDGKINDRKHEIEFEMKSSSKKGFNFGKDNHNEIFIGLHKSPIWNIELGIGAGDLEFDLSEYKIKKLEIETGAAAIDIRLGDLYKETYVDVESGVAKIDLAVPEGVGCEIKMDGALNVKDFDGFRKEPNSYWRTDNFDSSDKKIYIKISSGLSSVSVDRY